MAVPNTPDYSAYISAMTNRGNTGLGYSDDLYNWATSTGQGLKKTADDASNRSIDLANATMPTDPRLMAKWEQTYMPLYDAQAKDAMRMNNEGGNLEEQYAGKFSADTNQAFDAAKASSARQLQSYGMKRPGMGSAAIDATTANQRAAASVAASETGRLAARTESRGVLGQAIQTGTTIPAIGAQQAAIGQQANQQAVALPAQAITTQAGAYSPSLGYMQASYPYMAQWGSTMANAYNQALAGYNAGENSGGGGGALAGAGLGALGSIGGAYAGSGSGSAAITSMFSASGGKVPKMANGGVIKYGHGGVVGDILSTVGGIAGSVLGGMYGGPAGAQAGGKAGSALGMVGGDLIAGQGDYVDDDLGDMGADLGNQAMQGLPFAEGGQVTQPGNPQDNANFVDPSASPTRGAIVDDVPARLNAGEFVLPEDVVSWLGEEKLHKLIMSTRQKKQETEGQSGAVPEMAEEPAAARGGAINMRPPRFISEGARA